MSPLRFSLQGIDGREAQARRDLRRLPRLQQEDPAHGVAPARKHHRRRRHQQPLLAAGQVLRCSGARATTFVKRLGQRTRLIGDWRMNSKMKFPISEKRRESRTVFREKPGSECVRRSKRSERKAAVFNLVKHIGQEEEEVT